MRPGLAPVLDTQRNITVCLRYLVTAPGDIKNRTDTLFKSGHNRNEDREKTIGRVVNGNIKVTIPIRLKYDGCKTVIRQPEVEQTELVKLWQKTPLIIFLHKMRCHRFGDFGNGWSFDWAINGRNLLLEQKQSSR